MKNLMIVTVCILLITSTTATGRTPLTLKDSKVYVTSNDARTIPFGSNNLDKHGYCKVVTDKNSADYIINYQVKKTWIISFLSRNKRGYAQVINAHTGEVIYTTKQANTFFSMFSVNHSKTIARQLNRSIEHTLN
jgi:hypothetical protein